MIARETSGDHSPLSGCRLAGIYRLVRLLLSSSLGLPSANTIQLYTLLYSFPTYPVRDNLSDMASFVLPSNYAFVALAASGALWLNLFQGTVVSKARKEVSGASQALCDYSWLSQIVPDIGWLEVPCLHGRKQRR